MNVRAVSDTDVFLDWLQGRPQANATFELYDEIVMSRVSWIEVLAGAKTPERDASSRRAMLSFPIIEISEAISEEAAQIRRTSRLKLPDAIILATARVMGCSLLTRNTKDFYEGDSTVIIPYRI